MLHESALYQRGGLDAGCSGRRSYFLLLEREGKRQFVATDTDLAAAFAPIESDLAALTLVALLFRDVYDPFTQNLNDDAISYGWQPVRPTVRTSVERSGDDAWLIRWPVVSVCGCSHPMVLRTFIVRRDGSVTEKPESATLITRAAPLRCVD
jgi:hypothetical protein